MKTKTALGAALLATVLQFQMQPAAAATSTLGASAAASFASEFDETLPPVGYVRFCAENSAACASYSLKDKLQNTRTDMTPQRWAVLYQVNTWANARIKPESDQQLYGEAERWAYPTSAGDCEDYVLLKQRSLERMGFPAKSLRITVVLDERGEGHAVLTVTTAEGDYVLDNRRNDILLWNDTNYTFLKRQSDADPRRWVALIKAPAVSATTVSSGQGK